MNKLVLAVLFLCTAPVAFCQQADSGRFLLHKFEQLIGQETYTKTSTTAGTHYQIDFRFTDRGTPVPLTASCSLDANGNPQSFQVNGNTSRFSTVADSIVISNGRASITENKKTSTVDIHGPTFPIAGYAPCTIQMLLLQYWKTQQQPQTIQTLPGGSLQIMQEGKDSLPFRGQTRVFGRFIIKGLIWGAEIVWTDQDGRLVCLMTNDAEGDKTEMMRAEYEALLPMFIEKAAVYGMQIFTKSVGKNAGEKPGLMAITHAAVLDLQTGKLQPDNTVLISNGKITQIAPAASLAIPKNAFVIDAKGKTLLPGLWDMHAHFEQADWGPAYLATGITTVRDCGGEFGYINTIKRVIDEGQGIGPHILKAGIIDGKGPRSAGIITASSNEEAIARVRTYKDNGFVQIKIYSSVPAELVKVICDEAHRLGMTVTGHIPSRMSLEQGVEAGMDMVNHNGYVFRMMKVDTINYTVQLDDAVSKAALAFIKKHHVVIDPTLAVFELGGRPVNDSITAIEPDFYKLPVQLQSLLRNTGVADSADIAFYKAFMVANKKIVKALADQGTTIVAGTDMSMPGYSLYRELELYVQAGLTPLQALRTATIVPAQVMKMDRQTGSVAIGKDADLILVEGNPAANIQDIRKLSMVIKGGRIYNPVIMRPLAGFAE
ncbi:MAG TPA: amidohydrolase family protein [Chitinophagaceae bacterium]|nr:amidohydrolase family protein [Chitinophagaceae bacterium]